MTNTEEAPRNPFTVESDRLAAVRKRDEATARVRRLSLGVITMSVAAAAVGAVALSAPATPAVTTTAAGPSVTTVASKGGAVNLAPTTTAQAPVAATGGS